MSFPYKIIFKRRKCFWKNAWRRLFLDMGEGFGFSNSIRRLYSSWVLRQQKHSTRLIYKWMHRSMGCQYGSNVCHHAYLFMFTVRKLRVLFDKKVNTSSLIKISLTWNSYCTPCKCEKCQQYSFVFESFLQVWCVRTPVKMTWHLKQIKYFLIIYS